MFHSVPFLVRKQKSDHRQTLKNSGRSPQQTTTRQDTTGSIIFDRDKDRCVPSFSEIVAKIPLGPQPTFSIVPEWFLRIFKRPCLGYFVVRVCPTYKLVASVAISYFSSKKIFSTATKLAVNVLPLKTRLTQSFPIDVTVPIDKTVPALISGS
jgi:hypothetical protein